MPANSPEALLAFRAAAPTRSTSARPVAARLGAALLRFAARIAEAERRHADLGRIEAMSDRELADIGLTRDALRTPGTRTKRLSGW